MTKEFLPRI
jgi:hypothetical protein